LIAFNFLAISAAFFVVVIDTTVCFFNLQVHFPEVVGDIKPECSGNADVFVVRFERNIFRIVIIFHGVLERIC